jgi:hypothetical protein
LDGQVGHVEDILAAVQDTDMAKATTPEQGRWLLKNGFTLWMFDGLDEFYEGSDGFFDEIAHLLDEPGSQARFLLCTRDSLLSSSSRLRAFVDSRLSGARDIELLEIAPWGEDAWRAMAETELGKGARAENFVGALRSSPVTGEMARLPFYCRVMLDRFKADGVLPADPLEVLDFIFDSMVAREHGKAIFRWKDFVDEDLLDAAMEEEGVSPAAESAVERQAFLDYLDREGRESVVELICALAHALRRGAAPHGSFELEAADIRDIAGKAYVSNDLGNEVHGRRLQVLVQFAFFGAGVRAGTVDFTHPILADYLAGRYALTLLERAAQSLAKNVELRPSDLKIPQGAIRQAVGAGAVDRNSIFFQTVKRGAKDDALIAAFLKRMTQERFPEPHIQDFMNLIST